MKRLLSIFLFFILFLTGCGETAAVRVEDPNLAAKVNGEPIYIQDIEKMRGNSGMTEEQALKKLIDNKLLFAKIKKENRSMTDDEVKQRYKGIMKKLEPDAYQDGDENAITTEQLQALRETFLITQYKAELGGALDDVLKELRSQAKIKYFR